MSAKHSQEIECVGNRGGRGRFEPRELLHVAFAETEQLKHCTSQIDAADFGIGLGRPGLMRHRAPEPNADPRLRPTGSAGALIGGGS
jgi:hypothetical protein